MATTRHYSIPTFLDTSDRIELRKYLIHQPLLVKNDINGNCELYIVIDNTVSGFTSILDAINNDYIRSFTMAYGANLQDITYDELYTKAKNADLQPGQWYRLTDYNCINQIGYRDSNFYTSPDLELIIYAYKPDQISSLGLDPQNTYDIVSYDVWPLISAGGYYLLDSSNNIVDSDFWSNDPVIEFFGITSDHKFDVQFNSDTEVYVGSETKPLSDNYDEVFVSCYDSGGNPVRLPLSDPNVTWDNSAKTITLSGGYTFSDGSFRRYELGNNFGYYSPEIAKGRVYHRKDLKRNIEADFDWRNYRVANYHCQVPAIYDPEYNGNDNGYWTNYRTNNLVFYYDTQDINISVDTSDYELAPVISPVSNNVRIVKSKFFSIRSGNVKNLTIENVKNLHVRTNSIDDVIFRNCGNVTLLTSSILTSVFNKVFGTWFGGRQTLNSCKFYNFNQNLFNSSFSYFDSEFGSVAHVTFPKKASKFDRVKCINGCDIFNMFDVGNADSQLSYVTFNGCRIYWNLYSSANLQNVEFKGRYTDGTTYGDHTELSTNIEYSKFDGIFSGVKFVNPVSHVNYMGNMTDMDFPQATESNFICDLDNLTIPEHINLNTITINSDKVLYPISLYINVDTSSNAINLELPGNPKNGTDFVVIDTGNNAGTNHITISISSSPEPGVINTINGGTGSVSIETNYGFMELRYSDLAGWIIIKESSVSPLADEITLHKENNVFSINEIDYIIDDDNQSIDSSNTPASDAHRELVTRAYVDLNISNSTDIHYSTYNVTSAYTSGESIDITTGNGSNSGTSNLIRNEITTLGATQSDFENNNKLQVFINGAKLEKTIDINYIDATHLSFNIPLDISDVFEIKQLGE